MPTVSFTLVSRCKTYWLGDAGIVAWTCMSTAVAVAIGSDIRMERKGSHSQVKMDEMPPMQALVPGWHFVL